MEGWVLPHSNLNHIPAVVDHMQRLAPGSILDIGVGAGWYSTIFRGILEPQPSIIGIEAIPEYVDRFGLNCLYDELHINDVRICSDELLNSCDVVFMGDVIEHLTLEDGYELLARIQKPIVLDTPDHFFENPADLPWSETHRSLWTKSELKATGRLVRFTRAHVGHVVTLRAAGT
jgi:Protein-L-isoaspartate(D-aspartate) O-methyltransferase (PCMT)